MDVTEIILRLSNKYLLSIKKTFSYAFLHKKPHSVCYFMLLLLLKPSDAIE